MSLELMSGRNYSEEFSTDQNEVVVVNEKMFAVFTLLAFLLPVWVCLDWLHL